MYLPRKAKGIRKRNQDMCSCSGAVQDAHCSRPSLTAAVCSRLICFQAGMAITASASSRSASVIGA